MEAGSVGCDRALTTRSRVPAAWQKWAFLRSPDYWGHEDEHRARLPLLDTPVDGWRSGPFAGLSPASRPTASLSVRKREQLHS